MEAGQVASASLFMPSVTVSLMPLGTEQALLTMYSPCLHPHLCLCLAYAAVYLIGPCLLICLSYLTNMVCQCPPSVLQSRQARLGSAHHGGLGFHLLDVDLCCPLETQFPEVSLLF